MTISGYDCNVVHILLNYHFLQDGVHFVEVLKKTEGMAAEVHIVLIYAMLIFAFEYQLHTKKIV